MFNVFEYLRNGAKNAKIHLVGVGGVGMYSLARLALKAGASVFGSDRCEGDYTADLSERGCKIFIPHTAKSITRDIDAVVY